MEVKEKTAVKALYREDGYRREVACYRRLTDVKRIGRFWIPELLAWDDSLLVIELRIVFPPFILDFAKAYVDVPPDFSSETLADNEEAGAEMFGERWEEVQGLITTLRYRYGIFYYDVKPGNIQFPDELD